ncbi:hypothetical protein PCC9214_02427 [Planktothrix tepida]|uniref:DUF4239 domain-containing protein n=2 Tax=Planktothrix TaxID=54304 RepID=A0A1J1LIP7_9CYAN|nr:MULTISPECIES: hypothetical protein [Planktothrix]CAD5948967.1 hypothetical protein PCC9214_02427 [Planktothrix tepida]CAD5961773.1 hypothetical protein NO713_03247 [Planktothrix pseudagardhii]CUR32469.1 conserved membrane hypothetical protein [Planktothrix tepida PCC 9214]
MKWITHQLGWQLGTFDSQMGSLLAAVTFIVAFMLGGTLSDYRICEDIPIQIVNAIETIQDSNLYLAARKPEYDPQPLTQGLFDIVKSILLWLEKAEPLEQIEKNLTDLNQLFVTFAINSDAPIVARIQGEQAKIRVLVTRIERIRDTEFMTPAYSLLKILLVSSLLALLLIETPEFTINLMISGLISLSLSYILVLIYDLDNPFEYDGKSSADVDLSPLKKLLEQLQPNPLQGLVLSNTLIGSAIPGNEK